MKYHNIPTRYQGAYFRSRLEARWAAFFDLCGWKWNYEPFDLKGWIPDFIIQGYSTLLVEVKPHITWDEYIPDATEIQGTFDDGSPSVGSWFREDRRELLFLGAFPDTSDEFTFYGGPAARLGWFHSGDPALVVAPATGGWGLSACYGSYTDRISGKGHKEHNFVSFDAVRSRFSEANQITRYNGTMR